MGYGKELKEFEYRAQWINKELKKIFHQMSLDLIDFKLEFGYDAKGNLILADELSPDGMRLWSQGNSVSYDKDIFRKDGDGEKMLERYREILGSLLQIHTRDLDAYNERTMKPEYEQPIRGPI
jgi:phosphoribosylaminoimidazole-succinocarboxamide synthase